MLDDVVTGATQSGRGDRCTQSRPTEDDHASRAWIRLVAQIRPAQVAGEDDVAAEQAPGERAKDSSDTRKASRSGVSGGVARGEGAERDRVAVVEALRLVVVRSVLIALLGDVGGRARRGSLCRGPRARPVGPAHLVKAVTDDAVTRGSRVRPRLESRGTSA